jgi:biotin operon repressor BirA-like protein
MPFSENTRASQPQEHILKILLSESPVSGKTLGHELKIPPQAVQGHIRQLRDEGFEIRSLRGKGYRLEGLDQMV